MWNDKGVTKNKITAPRAGTKSALVAAVAQKLAQCKL